VSSSTIGADLDNFVEAGAFGRICIDFAGVTLTFHHWMDVGL
jgi:hypothetical protein